MTPKPEVQGDQESWNKDDSWEAWAKGAEGWLLNKHRVNKAPYRGRGQEDKLDKTNHISPTTPTRWSRAQRTITSYNGDKQQKNKPKGGTWRKNQGRLKEGSWKSPKNKSI